MTTVQHWAPNITPDEEWHEFEIVPHRHCDCVHEGRSGLHVFTEPHVVPSLWLGSDQILYRYEILKGEPQWLSRPPDQAFPLRRLRETGGVLHRGPLPTADPTAE